MNLSGEKNYTFFECLLLSLMGSLAVGLYLCSLSLLLLCLYSLIQGQLVLSYAWGETLLWAPYFFFSSACVFLSLNWNLFKQETPTSPALLLEELPMDGFFENHLELKAIMEKLARELEAELIVQTPVSYRLKLKRSDNWAKGESQNYQVNYLINKEFLSFSIIRLPKFKLFLWDSGTCLNISRFLRKEIQENLASS